MIMSIAGVMSTWLKFSRGVATLVNLPPFTLLVPLDFLVSALAIILNVDASMKIGWGGILSQLQADGTMRPARFESGIWNTAEKEYDAVKLECRGLLKALKKWLAYIRLFDFDVKHIPGNKNGAADVLSRCGQSPDDPEGPENEPDDYFDAQLYSAYVSRNPSPTVRIYLHELEY